MSSWLPGIRAWQGDPANSNKFKTDLVSRKTFKYFDERLKLWSEFETNDDRIRIVPDPPIDHIYFTEGYYSSIQEIVLQYQELFRQKMHALCADGAAVGPSKLATLYEESTMTEEITKANTTILGVIRRKAAMMASIDRLVTGLISTDVNHQTSEYFEFKLQTQKQLWRETEALNYTIWELSDTQQSSGYDME